MIDVYIGVKGCADSVMELEFDNFKEASDFCDTLRDHYKEERKKLFVAIERKEEEHV